MIDIFLKGVIGLFAVIGVCEVVSWIVDYIANKNG